jgi:hypothetical protein
MMEQCHTCGKFDEEQCGRCESTAIESGTVEIIYNGYLAKSLEVFLCGTCDGVWLRTSADERIFVCSQCRHKALSVSLRRDELRKAS